MSVDEAYDLVMKTVEELRADGVRVDCIPHSGADVEAGGDLSREKWMHIEIHTDDLEKIFEIESAFHKQGITFDTGYNLADCIRDWEIDWSFSFEPLTKPVSEMRMDSIKELLT